MPENNKSVLVLGGTGAMGISLVNILADQGWDVCVTSRQEHQSERGDITYLKGNAKQLDFLTDVLKYHYDAIVDFMSYTTEEFDERADLLLNETDQYLFLSSARVYAESDKPLTEDSPRLLDVCKDADYLATDEYALAKARQEDILTSKRTKCYTIIRPSLTYNDNRLQLVISEKEEWLYRTLHGRKVVLPEDIMDVKTTMTWGRDVAVGIAGLVGNEKAYGETVHIASTESRTWKEILEIYQAGLEEKIGDRMEIVYESEALVMGRKLDRYYQIKYARGVSRKFDSSKIQALTGGVSFTAPETGLKMCLEEFLNCPKFGTFQIRSQAYFDRVTGEKTSREELGSKERAVKYYILRYSPYFNFYHGDK